MEPNSIYSPEGSIPFKRYFHGTQIKIKSSQNQKKRNEKKIQKKDKQTLNGPTLSKRKEKKEDEEEGLMFRTSES